MATLAIIPSKADNVTVMCEYASPYRIWGYGDFDTAYLDEIVKDCEEKIDYIAVRYRLNSDDFEIVREYCRANGIEFGGHLLG